MFRGSTLGRKIAGTVETMNGIKRDRMMGFRDKYYVPERTVVAVAGKFDVGTVLPMLEKTFGARKVRKTPPTFDRFSVAKGGYKAPRVHMERKETEQVQVAVGWAAYGHDHPGVPALRVMSTILGGNMSSRLFLSVREKAGLAYSVRASHGAYQDVGVFSIQAGLSKAKVHKAMGIIMKEARRLKDKDVTTEELNRAKEYLKGRMMLDLEDSSRLASWYAMQELLQRKVETPEDRLARIAAVTKADIRAAAKDVMRRDRTVVAVIGPYAKADAAEFARHARAI
jgi:predicted Zn-dependent peptidase